MKIPHTKINKSRQSHDYLLSKIPYEDITIIMTRYKFDG